MMRGENKVKVKKEESGQEEGGLFNRNGVIIAWKLVKDALNHPV